MINRSSLRRSGTPHEVALTVACPAKRGIVALIAGFLAEHGCNITDSSQFDDTQTGRFFMRVSFVSEEGVSISALHAGFARVSDRFGMEWAIHDEARRIKVIIMVSRFGHCLHDLLYRWRIGAPPIDIVAVISNHFDYQKVVVNHDIPFHYIPTPKGGKLEAEARQMRLVEETGAELIVLARYMHVLSDEMRRTMSGRIINIHHLFLPAFKGANPYKQAFERGVKLIGATSHYITADLDEGPIIEQDAIRVTMRKAQKTMSASDATWKAWRSLAQFTRAFTGAYLSMATRPWCFRRLRAPTRPNEWGERRSAPPFVRVIEAPARATTMARTIMI